MSVINSISLCIVTSVKPGINIPLMGSSCIYKLSLALSKSLTYYINFIDEIDYTVSLYISRKLSFTPICKPS